MLASLLCVGLVLASQSPDGAGPMVSPPPPAASPAPAPAPPPEAAPTPSPAPQPASPPAATQQPAPAAKAAEAPKVDLKKPKKDHISGLFVSGVGAAVVTVGAVLGGIGALFMLAPRIPFPGGAPERETFTSSAVVGATFMVLVGMSLVTVGVALVAVSFL